MPSRSAPAAFLAVDLGSSSGRVMLGLLEADAETFVVTEAGRFANVPVRRTEGLGWDVDALWEDVLAGLHSGVALARAAGAPIAGIGVDSWGVDYGRLTPDGRVRPFVRHHRAVDAALAARSSIARDAAADYAITGVLDQAINTVHQLREDAARGIGAPDDRILLISDLFIHLLCGAEASEASLASSTALIDRATEDWSTPLTAGLPAVLPRIVFAGTRAGATRAEVTARIGADGPVAVWYTTAHDTAAAFSAIVSAASGAGTAVISCGSWVVVGVVLERPILSDGARRAGFTQEIGADGETLLVKNLSGMWLLQQVMREWANADGRDDWSVAALRDLLADAATSSYPGTFDPADPALQAPGGLVRRLEDACALSAGSAPRDRADLVRAILESLARAYAHTIRQIEELTGRSLVSVRLVGGGARNELLGEITAQRTGLPVIAGPAEASIHGLLLQLAVAAGHLPDLETARAVSVEDGEEPARRHEPAASALPIDRKTGMTPPDLLADLSRRLGDPAMDAALLGEGNTSIREGGVMRVKATGAILADAQPGDFVRVDLAKAGALISDPAAADAEVDAFFSAIASAEGRRPSVEALLHVVIYEATDAAVIAHSHPTAVNALLCSRSAELLVAGALFPDQVVVLGARPLLVPYIDPGIRLARVVREMIRAHIDEHGAPPHVIYLRNHGMFALGATPAHVLGMTAMAQKCARAIIGAQAAGGVQFMPADEVARIDARPDEKYRRALLAQQGAR